MVSIYRIRNGAASERPADVKLVLERLFNTLNLEEAAKKWRVVIEWEQIVGRRIAEVSKAASVRGKTLVVEVAEGIWANELNFLKKMIIDKINKHLCNALIDDIYFKVAPINRKTSAGKLSELERRDNFLTEDQKQVIGAKIDGLADGALKDRLKSLLLKIPLSGKR